MHMYVCSLPVFIQGVLNCTGGYGKMSTSLAMVCFMYVECDICIVILQCKRYSCCIFGISSKFQWCSNSRDSRVSHTPMYICL